MDSIDVNEMLTDGYSKGYIIEQLLKCSEHTLASTIYELTLKLDALDTDVDNLNTEADKASAELDTWSLRTVAWRNKCSVLESNNYTSSIKYIKIKSLYDEMKQSHIILLEKESFWTHITCKENQDFVKNTIVMICLWYVTK